MKKKKKSAFKIDKEKFYFQKFGSVKPRLKEKCLLWLLCFGIHAVAIYRYGQFCARLKKRSKLLSLPFRIVRFILERQIDTFRHVKISGKADIGPGFYIPRGYNIIIPGIKIGSNFTVHHNVSLGTGYTGDEKSKPTIGNDVWVGIGSILAGSIKIGNGVTISSGSIVFKDIPDHAMVAGNPGRVVIKDHDNSRWLRYKMPESQKSN